MSVTAAKGFVASGVAAGIRRKGLDLAVVRSTVPAVGAAMFTVNQVLAAPVVVSKQHLAVAEPQAIVINSGVANAATGERGELDALATAAEAGRLLDLYAEDVLVLSTGVIGVLLPLEKVLGGLRDAVPALLGGGGPDAAEAILTTDTRTKESAVSLDGFSVGGMAKGSGMIHPQLATMLAVVTTDYPLEPGEAIDFLRPAVDAELQLDLGRRRVLDERRRLPARERRERDRADARLRHRLRARARPRLRRARAADRRRRRGRDGARRDRGQRRRRRRAGAGDRVADRHLAARQDRPLRPRRELGPGSGRRRLGSPQRRLRVGRGGARHALLQRHAWCSSAARRPASSPTSRTAAAGSSSTSASARARRAT